MNKNIDEKILLSKKLLSKNVKKYLCNAIEQNVLSRTYDNYINDFEKMFGENDLYLTFGPDITNYEIDKVTSSLELSFKKIKNFS